MGNWTTALRVANLFGVNSNSGCEPDTRGHFLCMQIPRCAKLPLKRKRKKSLFHIFVWEWKKMLGLTGPMGFEMGDVNLKLIAEFHRISQPHFYINCIDCIFIYGKWNSHTCLVFCEVETLTSWKLGLDYRTLLGQRDVGLLKFPKHSPHKSLMKGYITLIMYTCFLVST